MIRTATVGLVVVVVVIVTAALLWPGGTPEPLPAAALSTAAVQRTDLVVTEEHDGKLGFGATRRVPAGRAGVITSVASAGTTVTLGAPLFAIDLEPTVLLAGEVPAYRDLDTGSPDGPDVAQLERYLADAGFGAGLTVDENFTAATADAVRGWEESLGRADPDGTVELGDVVFADGPQRLAAVDVGVGAQVQAGGGVVRTTPTIKVVTLDLDPDAASGLVMGNAVALRLPGGKATTGKITSVGTATETTAAEPGAESGAEPTVPIVITPDDPAAADGVDSATVAVAVERSRDEGVLAVPVTALLALAEGGYAVQVVDPAAPQGHRLVAVQVGTFADEKVAVTGAGIEDGVKVVAP
ncbi:MAG: peptidoglycan-binding protein [Pseudonocardiaceae bacterium]